MEREAITEEALSLRSVVKQLSGSISSTRRGDRVHLDEIIAIEFESDVLEVKYWNSGRGWIGFRAVFRNSVRSTPACLGFMAAGVRDSSLFSSDPFWNNMTNY